jgi:hypothetical protein
VHFMFCKISLDISMSISTYLCTYSRIWIF